MTTVPEIMQQTTVHFGEHFTLDGYGGDHDRLNSRALVQQVLDELPGLLDMKKLSRPEVYFAPGNDKKDPGGWTGVVVIEESHISLHTFPKRGFISADVYTCTNGLDVDYIEDYFVKQFGIATAETNFLIRGRAYPSADIYE